MQRLGEESQPRFQFSPLLVATFNIDFASRDGNRTHQNAFRSCDSNFVRKTIEIERIKNFGNQIERTLLRSKKSLAMS